MSEMNFSGSVSQRAMEAAIREMEELVAGRIGAEDFERQFGPRWAPLQAMGILNEALISAYARKAAEEDGDRLIDENQQARLTLARYDECRAAALRKRRRKSSKPAKGAGKTDAGDVRDEAALRRRADGDGSAPAVGGDGSEARGSHGERSPTGPAGNGWQP